MSSEEKKNTGGKSPALRRRFQCGNWRCRNGVWSCKYREYIPQPDGTYKILDRGQSFPGLSERAAKAAMNPILAAVNQANLSEAHLVVPTGSRTMTEVMEDWRKLVAPHRKPRGVETTESHWRAHIGPELGQVPVSQLDLRRVQEFVNKISPGRSGKQVENIVLTLTGMLRHASKWDKDVKPISVSDLTLPAKAKSKPRFYEVEEIKRLIAAAPEPLKTILMVLVLTGLRINEALALRLEDLDFNRKLISVRHSAYNGQLGTPKTEASVADLHMPPPLEKKLKEFISSEHYRKNDLDLLFCNRKMRPFSDNKLREKMLRPLLRQLEMYSPGKVFHAIRHTAGSVMLESGASIVNVQKQLRHSAASTTLNIYSHVLGDSQRKAVNKLARRFLA